MQCQLTSIQLFVFKNGGMIRSNRNIETIHNESSVVYLEWRITSFTMKVLSIHASHIYLCTLAVLFDFLK